MKPPKESRTQRLFRQLNAAQDAAALRTLEDSMARARRQAEMAETHAGESFLEHRDDTFELPEEVSDQLPGLEDDENDDGDDDCGAWVTLTEEEPDAIDLMVQASNERHRQRAREFNWNALLDSLHPIYMIQKAITKNWAGSNAYDDFAKPCNCAQSNSLRTVDLVDIYAQRRVGINFCSCTPDAIRLLQLGYLAGSPIHPQTAFSLPLLIFHNHLWNNCHVGALPFTVAMTQFLEPRSQRLHARNHQHARDLRKPFTAALTDQKILASLSCPACFGPQPLSTSMYPETTRDRLVVCLDGNFQHRHHSKASQNHEQLCTPKIFLGQAEVDQATCLIREREMKDNTPEQVDQCTQSHKAADDKRNESTWKGCDDTGLMGCCCRHDAAIYLANIHKSGEQRCFPLAILQRLLSVIEPTRQVGVLYDIGCSLDKFINLRKLLEKDRPRLKFGTSVFHAYVHNWNCQLDYHPRFNKGWGLSDGEGLERMWSYLSPLVSPLRYATRNHRLASIAHQLAHHNRKGIKQLSTLLGKRNPHSPNNRNYTRAFFLRQWSAQRSFQEDHTDVEEARMKKLVALYERENVIDLLRCCLRNPRTLLASESEVRELLDSIKLESEKLKEEVENLSSGDMPAGNVEERKMRLLLWSAKSELFVQAVHLMAERQPLCDAKNTRSRLGTRLKEKVFKAINNRRPAIDKLIDEYNKKYSQYKLKFPDCAGSTVGDNGLLSYETLSSLSLDDAFWNDGLFHHSDAPWAIDPNVREGIRCMLVLDRIQEEFELISQEVVRSMSWAIGLHDQLVKYIGYLQDRINLMSNNSSERPIDHFDAIHLPGLNRKEKANEIKIELGNRLASHTNCRRMV
ncbi:uncharacterized protein PGTG_21590 [Puccinia graminis f. sp. tritici CRL 75-36-700-3]|uniref:CxC1-like cysteine cluster associated with KDZ transposases domain-containing protein n=1 Tax=Puccinia graminis f. sp. tritici (strain CRL 75-36-700-3 / race SCCL) TaxID=418459 RepID=H6QRX5_PUCGT|nr:uncharacterized protein PGTG_21590 [Puccinia graminis f. sp. tritici CRL 75-36-700-3]EHS63459.1 hypothetical protein PGTG_21590 [Puccinia graminis f. sp. tritici CRL 75-36-700-3]